MKKIVRREDSDEIGATEAAAQKYGYVVGESPDTKEVGLLVRSTTAWELIDLREPWLTLGIIRGNPMELMDDLFNCGWKFRRFDTLGEAVRTLEKEGLL